MGFEMRGYFAIGIEGVSKSMNVGSVLRTAHAFGAAFVFTVGAVYPRAEGAKADTSDTPAHLPFYEFPTVADMILPGGCIMIGVEISDDATELPSFRHPQTAAYVLGPERGALSPDMTARCQSVVKIPTRFSVNLAVAGAIVMYDRMINLGRFGRRPETFLAEPEPMPDHVYGAPVLRAAMDRFRAVSPGDD
jgi:tRNA G18 (ribose-2'-O)-methylase SpoU